MRKYIHLAQPTFGDEEKKEVIDALDSGWVTLGPRTKQFEDLVAAYVGSKYAVGVSSCTAGLHLSLLTAGIGPGDEVITTIFTFAATSNTIIQSGATPVFVDIDPKTFNIDPALIESKITKKTKAIMPMDYGGQPCDYDAIKRIAQKHNLILIEDAATSIGASYKGVKVGNIVDLTSFSFHPIKNISTGDGGMVTTHNQKYAERLTELRLHGMSKEAWNRHSKAGSWMYDIVLPGFKYNMTDISAALGIHQIQKLDKFIEIRQKYCDMYNKAFINIPEITVPYVSPDVTHARNLYTIQLDIEHLSASRDQIVEDLKAANIGVSVYYIPLYEFSYYKKTFGLDKKDFPVAQHIFERMMSLPLFPGMTEEEVGYVSDTVIELIKKYRS